MKGKAVRDYFGGYGKEAAGLRLQLERKPFGLTQDGKPRGFQQESKSLGADEEDKLLRVRSDCEGRAKVTEYNAPTGWQRKRADSMYWKST